MHHLCLCSFFALECCPERAGPRCRLAGSTVTFVTPGTHPESVYASLNPTWHPHSHSHTLRVLRPLPLPSWKAYKRLCLVGSSFYRRRLPPPGNSPAPHLSYGFCLLSPFSAALLLELPSFPRTFNLPTLLDHPISQSFLECLRPAQIPARMPHHPSSLPHVMTTLLWRIDMCFPHSAHQV